MAEAYIVDALRSPTGKRKGSLAAVHGADLAAHVIKAIVERNNIPAEDYDDVIFGCVDTIGSLAGCIARTSWLATSRGPAGWLPGFPRRSPARRSTGSAARRSRPCISPRRR